MKLSSVGARLLVCDVARSYDFYKDVLGYEVSWGTRDGVYVSFNAPGDKEIAFSIFKKENMSMYDGYVQPERKGEKVQLCIYIEDVDAAYELLKDKIKFLGEPRNMDEWYMRCVWFRDPDGNLLEISGSIKE